MHLRIFHRTRYVYRTAVSQSHNELRFRPASDNPRRLKFFLLKVEPPSRLRHFRDEYYNYVHWFEIPEPHQELLIEASMVIQTTSPYANGEPMGILLDSLKGGVDELISPFLLPSRYVSLDPEVWRLAVDIRQDRQDIFETALAIMRHVHDHWEYAPNTTHAATHLKDVMATRRGVCQDFTHLMIGLLRSLGIPARYVSGYLFNGPGAHLRGAQASHAWCEVWLPGIGWFGLDPTNATLADDRHVKIATGRDYDDAAPISGTMSGPPNATSRLEVTVRVEEASMG